MESSTDTKPTKLALEHAIIESVQKDNVNNCSVHFDYQKIGRVNVYTYNPKYQEKFLLTSGTGTTDEEALMNAKNNIVKLHEGQNSYTVVWKKHSDDSNMNTSYFVAHDIQDVLNKFYFHKDFPQNFLIYEIKLNPIS